MGCSVMEILAKRLAMYRRKCGLTQKELAEKLGVANTTVSGWERAASSIDIDTLYKVCGIFGITLGEMFGSELCGYTFTEEELEVVQGFRAHPKMRSAVRVLVGMDTVK